ncbi:MAG: MurT ligase domain-containing protein [Bacillota bacterium]|nr:MurT ligase domain-containing protein [Bacillota bacterium]
MKSAAKKFKVIMVTGTNGKTTTSAMITNILRLDNKSVISNNTGANMIDGILTCFIANYGKSGWAVMETDEAYTRVITEYLKPEFIVVTNVFRDQLDRFGEIYTTWEKIKDAILKSPESKLVFNGDLELFAKIDFKNPVFYYGFKNGAGEKKVNAENAFCLCCGERLTFNFITFSNLGDYYCENCGFKRPFLSYTLDEIIEQTTEGTKAIISGVPVELSVPGVYNVYNALAAFALADLAGIDKEQIALGLSTQGSCFGRNESIKVDGSSLHMALIKNPTGCDQCIDAITLYSDPCSLLFMLNDNWADGTDVSWVWDANFEKTAGMQYSKVLIGGMRRYDMAIRLKVAGLDEKKFVLLEDDNQILESVSDCKGKVFAFCTYTAMTGLRRTMYNKGIVKDMWK